LKRLDVTRLGWLSYAIALTVIVLDQLTKAYILYGVRLPDAGRVELGSIFNLTMVWNKGMSFGLLRAHGELGRWLLTVFAVVVGCTLIWWARKADKRLFAWAAGLLIGGALGNVIDRFRFGAVVDFIDVSAIGFFPWVFNIADSGITIGAILLLIEAFLPKSRTVLDSGGESGN
jgi:signal peptidase II